MKTVDKCYPKHGTGDVSYNQEPHITWSFLYYASLHWNSEKLSQGYKVNICLQTYW